MKKGPKPPLIEDQDVWEEYKKHVTPLKNSGKAAVKTQKKAVQVRPLKPKVTSGSLRFSSRSHTIQIESRLDLHGFTLQQAHEQLESFILSSYRKEMRCVLVITGKGSSASAQWWEEQGVLKNNVPRWLGEEPLKSKIIEYRVAKPEHGGSGALYVLLRKNKPEE